MSSALDLPRRPRFLDFKGRTFTAEELHTLASFPSLIRLDFQNCAVGDAEVRIFCGLPKLESLWLEGTLITDGVLPDIARLPKLNWLILNRTQITGTGFASFSEKSTLRTLWLSETPVADEALPFLARLPKLSNLVLKHTRVTPDGLLALAGHPTVRVTAADDIPAVAIEALEAEQRRQASRTPPSLRVPGGEAADAKAALLDFFAAMAAWERTVARSSSPTAGPTDWAKDQCAAIFARYCTPKERKYGRPNALSYSQPSEYEGFAFLDSEWLTARKVFFYTRGPDGFHHRYLVVKRRDGWLVDHKETLLNGWDRDYL
jgi:hypothetical protein